MTFNELLETALSTEYYNTNNAWGFGGAVGRIYNLPGQHKLYVLSVCYRHGSNDNILRLKHADGCIFKEFVDNKRNRTKIIKHFNQEGGSDERRNAL